MCALEAGERGAVVVLGLSQVADLTVERLAPTLVEVHELGEGQGALGGSPRASLEERGRLRPHGGRSVGYVGPSGPPLSPSCRSPPWALQQRLRGASGSCRAGTRPRRPRSSTSRGTARPPYGLTRRAPARAARDVELGGVHAQRRDRDRAGELLLLEIEAVVRLHHRVQHPRGTARRARGRPWGACSGAGSRAVIGSFGVGLDEQQAERRPVRLLEIAGVEEPHREVGEHAAVDDHVLVVRLGVLDPDRLEEDRDRHAHAHGECDLELVGSGTELWRRRGGSTSSFARADIGRDHLQPIGVLRVVPLGLQLGECARCPWPRAGRASRPGSALLRRCLAASRMLRGLG